MLSPDGDRDCKLRNSGRSLALAALQTSIALALIAGQSAGGASAEQIRYGVLTPPNGYVTAVGMKPLFARVEEETSGALTVQYLSGPQSPGAGSVLAALRSDALDAGFLDVRYHYEEFPLGNLIASLQAATANPLAAAGATLETILIDCPPCLAEYRNQGLLPLGGHSLPPRFLMCGGAVASAAELSGLSFGYTLDYHAEVAATTGLRPRRLAAPDVSAALRVGASDCIPGFKHSLETDALKGIVGTVIADAIFGAMPTAGLLTIRRSAWERLPAPARHALLVNMPLAIVDVTRAFETASEEAYWKALADGVQEIELGVDGQAAWRTAAASASEAAVAAAEKAGISHAREATEIYFDNVVKWEANVEESGGDTSIFAGILWNEVYSRIAF